MVVIPQNTEVGRIKTVSRLKNTPTTVPINATHVITAAPLSKFSNTSEISINCSRSIKVSNLLFNEGHHPLVWWHLPEVEQLDWTKSFYNIYTAIAAFGWPVVLLLCFLHTENRFLQLRS
jgi:hypothetical protein